MNDRPPALEISGLGKKYKIGMRHGRHDTLIDVLADRVGSLFGGSSRPDSAAVDPDFWALRNVSFQVQEGERVGIIGLNGAGKSTLLKIISRITSPTTGSVRIRGRVGALLEVGTGFHPELTGRENAYLYGSILGMSKADIARNFDSIAAFAELEQFVDTPVKRYSSGMYVRLAFSVAAHIEPEILLLDEVLAVGDLPFQRKCIEFAKDLRRKNATILFVSHNMFSIRAMCERVIYIKQGSVEFDGPTSEGLELYEKDSGLHDLSFADSESSELPVRITSCELMDGEGEAKTLFDYGEPLKVRVRYETSRRIVRPGFIIVFTRSDGIACCNFSSEADGFVIEDDGDGGTIELTTPPLKLVSEAYNVSILVREHGFQTLLAAQHGSSFQIRHELFDTHFGVFHETGQWS